MKSMDKVIQKTPHAWIDTLVNLKKAHINFSSFPNFVPRQTQMQTKR